MNPNEVKSWLDLLHENEFVLWIVLAMVVSMTAGQGIKWFVREEFPRLSSAHRRLLIWFVVTAFTFFSARYLLDGIVDNEKKVAAVLAICQVFFYEIAVWLAVKFDIKWLLRWLKLRRVSGDGADKVVDMDDKTVIFDHGYERRHKDR